MRKWIAALLALGLLAVLTGCGDRNTQNPDAVLPPDDVTQTLPIPDAEAEIVLSETPVGEGVFLQFNCQNQHLASAATRRALGFALQNESIASLDKDYVASTGFVPGNVPYTLDPNRTFRQETGDIFFQSRDYAVYTFQKAGYMTYEQYPKELTLLARQNDGDIAAEIITEWAAALGLVVTPEVADDETFDARLEAGDYTIALTRVACAEDMKSFFASFAIPEWQDTVYTELLAELDTILDTETYDKIFLYQTMEGRLFEQMPAVPLVYRVLSDAS